MCEFYVLKKALRIEKTLHTKLRAEEALPTNLGTEKTLRADFMYSKSHRRLYLQTYVQKSYIQSRSYLQARFTCKPYVTT